MLKKILKTGLKVLFFAAALNCQQLSAGRDQRWAGTWIHFLRYFNDIFLKSSNFGHIGLNSPYTTPTGSGQLFVTGLASQSPAGDIGEHGTFHKIVNEAVKVNHGKTWPEFGPGEWRYAEHGLAFLFGMNLDNVSGTYFEHIAHWGGATFDGYKGRNEITPAHYEGYVKAVFKDFIAKSSDVIAPAPGTTSSSSEELASAGFKPLKNPSNALQVNVLDADKLVFSTTEGTGSKDGADIDAMQNSTNFFSSIWSENLVYSWKGKKFKRLNNRAVDFRHSLKIYTGHLLKALYSNASFASQFGEHGTHNVRRENCKPMHTYGGEGSAKNPFNPFDPTSAWGVIDRGLAKNIKKKIMLSKKGDVWVHGSDAQPYIVISDAATAPYLLKYKDCCLDMAVGDQKGAIYYADGDIRIKDISGAKSWKEPYDEVTASSPWRSRYDVSLHQGEQTRWGAVTSQVASNNDAVYKTEPFLQGSEKVGVPSDAGSMEKLVMGKDDTLWAIKGSKVFKHDGGTSWVKAVGSKGAGAAGDINASHLSVGLHAKDRMIYQPYAADGAEKVFILIDDATKTWKDLGIAAASAEIGMDGTLVVIDSGGKLWMASSEAVASLNSPLGDIGATAMTSIVQNDGTAIPNLNKDPVNLRRHGDVVEITRDGKVMLASNSATEKASAGAAISFQTRTNKRAMPETKNGPLELEVGQWVVISGESEGTFTLKERVSGLLLSASGTLVASGGATLKMSREEIGKAEDFSLFLKSIDGAMEFTTESGVTISEPAAKIIMLAAACKVFVDDGSSLEPSAPAADGEAPQSISIAVNKEFSGKDHAPSAISIKERASTIINKLNEITKSDEARTEVSLDKPGLALVINKTIMAITGKFKDEKSFKKMGKKIMDRFGGAKMATRFDEKFKALKEEFKTLKRSKAEKFYNDLSALVANRIDGIIEDGSSGSSINDLTTWITQLASMSDKIPGAKALQDSGQFEKIQPLIVKMSAPLKVEEAIARLETLATAVGVANQAQKDVFVTILEKLAQGILPAASMKTAPDPAPTEAIGPIWRVSVHKKKLGKILSMASKFKTLNPALGADGHLSKLKNASLRDFQTDFLAKINQLLFKADPAHLDADGLWKVDTTDPTKTKSLLALDPTQCYTLEQFWQDFSAWKEWSPDLKNPAQRIPLMRICNQISDSVKTHFSGNSTAESIATEAQSMLKELASAGKAK